MFPWQQFAYSKPNHIALRDYSQGAVFTWAELAQVISDYAQQLQQYHIDSSSIVALKGKNNFHYFAFYCAVLQSGAAVLGLNPAFSAEKITALCQANQVQLLIECADQNVQFYPCQEQERKTSQSLSAVQALQSARTLILTSGSSGLPKAVVHHISAHLANAQGVCQLMHFQAEHSWLLSLPLYHVSGQGIVWRWLAQGAELRLPSENFYADALQATHLSLVPTQAQRLLDFIENSPQSAVKTQAILLGGAHIAVELTEKLTALGIAAYAGYGMTEMASTVFAKQCDGKAGVGQPLLGREFKIEQNEICLRGAGLASGYWLQQRLVPLTQQDGWFHTKDLGHWDGENLHILGRADNMFISGGENIQPEEIEKLLAQHEWVKQVFVLPTPDKEFGQRPVAIIQFNQSQFESAVNNLKIWLADKLEKFKQPVAYFPLPTHTQGNIKISRNELKQQLTQYLGK